MSEFPGRKRNQMTSLQSDAEAESTVRSLPGPDVPRMQRNSGYRNGVLPRWWFLTFPVCLPLSSLCNNIYESGRLAQTALGMAMTSRHFISIEFQKLDIAYKVLSETALPSHGSWTVNTHVANITPPHIDFNYCGVNMKQDE